MSSEEEDQLPPQDQQNGQPLEGVPPVATELVDSLTRETMASPSGRAAVAALPDVPWFDIMSTHIRHTIRLQTPGPIDETVIREGISTLSQEVDAHPLHAAAASGRVDASLCLALVRREKNPAGGEEEAEGFDCDVVDGLGKSAIHWAATVGAASWVSALISAGADPNLVDNNGLTPLHEATTRGSNAAVCALLKGGADASCRDKRKGHSPLHFAAILDSTELVRVLCAADARLEAREELDGFTPLMTAIANGRRKAAEALLECGANTETESVMVLTPLMIAALLGYVDLSKALLRAGADVHHAGIGSLTPLHLASEKGHAELVEALLQAGADPKAKVAHPPPRSTPLHSACRSTRLSCVVALLRGGADETIQDETPARQRHAGAAGPGAGGGGGDAPAALEPPSTTPLDVVGLGRFEPYQDPEARDGQGTETDEEHARRRNPETMKLIRQALRRAPADRAWRRRSWLVMLRAAPTTQCCSVSSPATAGLRGVGEGLARWGDAGPGGGKEAKREEKSGAVLSENVAGKGKGKGKGVASPAATPKRAKHEDAEEEGEEEPVVAEVLVDVEADGTLVSAGADACDSGGGGTLGSSCDAVGSLEETEESVGEGGGGGDDRVGALRCLCGRLFGLADVEEGAFRRVVSYL